MENFVFCNPTKIIFGEEAELKIVAEIASFGYKKTMILYGCGSVKRSGLYERVVRRVVKHELNFTEFGGIKSNPVLSHVKEGIEWARKNGVDSLLAIGGGSVIDEAKAIAAGFYHEGDVWDFFEKTSAPQNALPIFTVLTVAASSSEANDGCVVTNEASVKKYAFSSPLLYPKASALNPALTFTLTPTRSAAAAIDAMSHIMEVYFTKKAPHPLNDRLSFALLKTLMQTTEIILKNPNDYDARASFMWSASLALNGLLFCGQKEISFPNHLIEHSLSALYDISHGEGLSIVVPAWLSWHREKEPKKVDKFCKKLFGKTGAEGVAAFEAWLKNIGLPTRLEDRGIEKTETQKIISNIQTAIERSKTYKEYDKKTIEDIVGRAFR